jgi:Tfp pilus assembly protein PilO
MNDNDLKSPEQREMPEIHVNDYGATRDSAVVVEEAGRTVLLTEDETIIIEKEPEFDLPPKNRPRKVYGGMWGPLEIATAGGAFLAVLLVILVYVFLVVPSNRSLESKRLRRNNLEAELASAREKYGTITNTETHVAKLLASVNDFEASYLPVAASGQTRLYQRLNDLIHAYGLVNTTGPDYSPLDRVDTVDEQKPEERGKSKFKSIYPGVYVTTTLEGSYHNLRRFIRDIETGTDFVMISAVELEPSDSEAKQPGTNTGGAARSGDVTGGGTGMTAGPNPASPESFQPSAPKGKMHGAVVRLRLEMAAYFRRPGSAGIIQQ